MWSALPKLRHPKGFLLSVFEYRILSSPAARLYALVVPYSELLVAILVFSGVAVRFAAGMMEVLLTSFIIAIAVNVKRGRDLDCHCFGQSSRRKVGPTTIIQDAALMIAAGTLVSSTSTWWGLTEWSVFRIVSVVDRPVPPDIEMFLTCALIAAIGGLALRTYDTWRSRVPGGIIERGRIRRQRQVSSALREAD